MSLCTCIRPITGFKFFLKKYDFVEAVTTRFLQFFYPFIQGNNINARGVLSTILSPRKPYYEYCGQRFFYKSLSPYWDIVFNETKINENIYKYIKWGNSNSVRQPVASQLIEPIS